MADPPARRDSMPGSVMPAVLGRYEVRAKIGEGGMANVYVGCDLLAVGPRRVAALKIIKDELSANREFVDMLNDEARIVADLDHPNVIKLYELGDEKGRVFLAMELLSGQSLFEVWVAAQEKKRRIPYDLLAWLGARISDGLHHAHEHKNAQGESMRIVHRDVNPHNVFITYDGQVKIIDFGLAKAINRATKTAAGIVKGKLAYMSPEQATALEIDRRADVFALGTTLWELSTNRRLFRRERDLHTLKAIYAAKVPAPSRFRPEYPEALWKVLQRALARERDDRYPTAAALGRDLDAFVGSGERVVSSQTMQDFMLALFPDDRERQSEWLRTASGPVSQSLLPLKEAVPSEAKMPIAEAGAALDARLSPPSPREPVAPSAPPGAASQRRASSSGGPPLIRRAPVSTTPPPAQESRALVVALVLLGLVLAIGIVLLVTQS